MAIGWQQILIILIIALLWFFVLRPAQMGGNQALSFGRSRAKRVSENSPKVTFEDVAGIDEAKQELYEIVDFLKNTKKYTALGAKIPKGILLTGPPGVGKTHLARAIAGEAGVPFFHISGSDFVEMFVGVGAARVRDLFDTAKAHRPSLIFVDEIDAVGRQRGAGLGGGHDEREQTLNQLLVEMDGFDPNSGVILIAATNRPDVLDPAILRPGRFDRQIVVDVPDANGREAILKIHAKGKPMETDIDLSVIGKRTPGFTGADLANMLNESALLAARRGHARIKQDDLDEALDRVIAGPQRKSRVLDSKEREVIAYHEAGHAIVGELLEKSDPVHKVTILPRGMSLGSTWSVPETDKHLVTEQELLDDVTGLLGGRDPLLQALLLEQHEVQLHRSLRGRLVARAHDELGDQGAELLVRGEVPRRFVEVVSQPLELRAVRREHRRDLLGRRADMASVGEVVGIVGSIGLARRPRVDGHARAPQAMSLP